VWAWATSPTVDPSALTSGAVEGGSAPAMTVPSRHARLLAAAVVFSLLFVGTIRGQDDDFPFGPFRMYATRQSLDGTTTWYGIDGVTDDGRVTFLPGATYGMRRAELEGQVRRFVAEPRLLGELATAYARRRPGSAPLVEIYLVKHEQRLSGGRPVGERHDEVVATWQR
jgi:hypothetical protein